MIERTCFAMPKAAFFLCFLFCCNFILPGNTAQVCPKNPLAPTNSVSGIVVGTIVGAEKLVNGIVSYFYYIGENSVNQVIGVTSSLGDLVSKYTIKIQDFGSGLTDAIGGQIKAIYNGSAGSVRVLFDYTIKMENSVQSYVYKQIHSFSDRLVSGQITGDIMEVIRNPFRTISKSLKKTQEASFKLTNHIENDIRKVIHTFTTTGVPKDVKDIVGAPLKGVKKFTKDTESAIKTVRNETSQKLSGYASEFQNGGIIDKLVAVSSIPFGITTETWSLSLKISGAVKNSISSSIKDVVQPFLGQTLTERLGKIANFPLDLTEGFYKSTVDSVHQVGGVISGIAGGGSVGDQINMIIKHPLTVTENAWNTTKNELRDFSKASLGEGLTEQLGSALSSPGKVLSSTLSTLTNGRLNEGLKSLIDAPFTYLNNFWSTTKLTIGGITKGILGEHWTTTISNVLNSPGKLLSGSISSITGGGSLSDQIKTVFIHPFQTTKNIGSTLKNKTEELITSITGGGSLSTQLSTVLTKPVTLTKNIWDTTKKTIKGFSNHLIGKGLTEKMGKAFTSPMESFSNATASITGGGSLTTQMKTVLTKPFDITKDLWDKTKNITESTTKNLFGGDVINTVGKVFSSPFKAVSGLYNSAVSTVSGIGKGSGASISMSGDGSSGQGGGISGAIKSFINAPVDVLKGSVRGLGKGQQSIIGGLKGVYHSIPVIGRGSMNVAVKGGNTSIGGSGGAKGQSGGNVSAKGSNNEESKRKKRSPT